MEAALGKSNSHGGSESEEKTVVLESSSIADEQEAGHKEEIVLKVSEINNIIASKIPIFFPNLSEFNKFLYIYGDWVCDLRELIYAIFEGLQAIFWSYIS